MIVFDVGNKRFNYRVVGICAHDGHVLLHRAERDDFWSLPGGRGELLEPSTETIRREFREELGCDVEVERLVWVVESFFVYDHRRCHELAFYYKVRIVGRADLLDKGRLLHGVEGSDLRLVFRWFPSAALQDLQLYPSFLRSGLAALPDSVQHVIDRDG